MLTALEVKRLRYQELRSQGAKNAGTLLPNRIPDANGLYLSISPPSERYPEGVKSWRWDFRFNGRRCVTCYGQWPTLTLEKARDLHLDAKRMVASGSLPAVMNGKIVSKTEKLKASSVGDSRFRVVGEDWYQAEQRAAEKGGKPLSDSWKENFRRWLDLLYQDLGEMRLPDIEAPHALAIIKRIEAGGHAASAEFVRQTGSRVFHHGSLQLLAPKGFDPFAAVRGAVKVPKKRHHPKLRPEEIPVYIDVVKNSAVPEDVKLGLLILLHTFPRSTELTATPWTEIAGDLWTIPSSRMKKDREHVVPLSPSVQAMFARLRELAEGSPWVFPSPQNPREHRNRNTFNRTLRQLGFKDRFSPHSARSTAVSILADSGY